jgi:hypothetical protein
MMYFERAWRIIEPLTSADQVCHMEDDRSRIDDAYLPEVHAVVVFAGTVRFGLDVD